MSGNTYITELEPSPAASGLRLAVKDLIDVVGVPTTGGCRAYVSSGRGWPPPSPTRPVSPERAAGARIVGKANLHELAYGARGVNPWYGTPTNPFGAELVPGGSSSGSAVAVAEGSADVAYGTDTGGSVRIPAACCGVVGLKTTWGRVPLDGCLLLAPSLDTIGPLAADVAGVVAGMTLLEPGFSPGVAPSAVGRVRGHLPADPDVDAAIDAALAATGWAISTVRLDRWRSADAAARALSGYEGRQQLAWLLDVDPAGIGEDVAKRLTDAAAVTEERATAARATARAWREDLLTGFAAVPLLALPTLPAAVPTIEDPDAHLRLTTLTRAVNLAGCPAISVPVPLPGSRAPASLQLVAPWGGEELLCAAASVVEAAVDLGR